MRRRWNWDAPSFARPSTASSSAARSIQGKRSRPGWRRRPCFASRAISARCRCAAASMKRISGGQRRRGSRVHGGRLSEPRLSRPRGPGAQGARNRSERRHLRGDCFRSQSRETPLPRHDRRPEDRHPEEPGTFSPFPTARSISGRSLQTRRRAGASQTKRRSGSKASKAARRRSRSRREPPTKTAPN